MLNIKKGDIVLKGFNHEHDFPTTSATPHYQLMLKPQGGDIMILDSGFEGDGYNAIEVGLSDPVNNILIENVNFTTKEGKKLTNNAFSAYTFVDGATLTLRNCTFGTVSNPLRISNNTGAHINVVIENCTVLAGEAGNYRGLILFQDYTSKTDSEVLSNNFFNSELVSVTLKNVVYTDTAGNTTNTNELAEDVNVCHNDNDNTHQLIYVYADKGQPKLTTDQSRYPSVKIVK